MDIRNFLGKRKEAIRVESPSTSAESNDVPSKNSKVESVNVEEIHGTTSPADEELPVHVPTPAAVLPAEPYQPPAVSIPSQYAGKGKSNCLKFQTSWYDKFPWIHFDEQLKAVLCFICLKAESLHINELARKREMTFVTIGFTNWKKALEKFGEHDKSASHRFAREQLLMTAKPGVDAQYVNT